MLSTLEGFLYQLSTILLYPVVIALLCMVVWTVWCLGVFFRHLIDRLKDQHAIANRFKLSFQTQINEAVQSENPDVELTTLLRKWERRQNGKLDSIRFMIKAGPTLGLAGTLIPMGTSLASLSQGNMMAMSTNMVTAFTTTIIGIICGLVAYLISLIREKWLKTGFLECESYCELQLRKGKR